ncbi:MAG TPA: helix-turn-helix domain-containing protein, partial [Acidimicrobiales bacterium]|nr:helix-turn-helix domain-containing protein [Acidimicrobiales bacterium]
MRETDIQREARALGDPTRHRLFRYIVDAPGPVGVSELTDYVRLNHNAVRQHLAVLKDAGLVTEEVENRDRPGRPRLLY